MEKGWKEVLKTVGIQVLVTSIVCVLFINGLAVRKSDFNTKYEELVATVNATLLEVEIRDASITSAINYIPEKISSAVTAQISNVVEQLNSQIINITNSLNANSQTSTAALNNLSSEVAALKNQQDADEAEISALKSRPIPTGFTWRGAWQSNTPYAVNDCVSYSGSAYICILANSGNYPTSTTYWNLMAAKGDRGTSGGDGSGWLGSNQLIGSSDGTISSTSGMANYFILARFQCIKSGALNYLALKCLTNGYVQGAVYSDSGGAPLTLLTASDDTNYVGSGWNSISVSPISLVSGTYYWLAFIENVNTVGYTSGTTTLLAWKGENYSSFSFPSSLSGVSFINGYYNILIAGLE